MSGGPFLDTLAWNSPWRERAVGEKVLLSGGLLGCAVALPAWPAVPVTFVTCVGLLLGPAQVPVRALVRTVAALSGFLALGAIATALVQDPGPEAAGTFWRGLGLAVTRVSLGQAAQTTGHALAGTTAMLLLAATTPMTQLLRWAGRRGVPATVVEVADLTYRFVFLLLDTVHAVYEAQTARLGYVNRRAVLRSGSQLAAVVLVRAWDRAERLQSGLEGRGYQGAIHVLEPSGRFSVPFVLGSVLLIGGIVTVSLLAG
jgi:cobalt/nickel transport system permease protein